jgi:hypothetical protein
MERLVSALAEIPRRYQTDGSGLMNQEYIRSRVVTIPRRPSTDKPALPL